jgi:GPH family glycoside/pentoside/hexuronide:cation symporter
MSQAASSAALTAASAPATGAASDAPPPASANKPVPPIPPEERVPWKEKLAYGAGGIGGSIQSTADTQLWNPVFVVTLGISPALLGLRALLDRAWDAVTDAMMGWLSDRTKSRWGRRKPYILIGGLLSSCALPLPFFLSRGWSEPWIIAWMIFTSLVIATCTTIWNIPYQCMLLEVTPNSRERTNVAAWRSYIGAIGGLGMGWIWYMTQLPIFHIDGKPDTLNGARWVVSGFGLLALGLCLLPLFTKERVHSQPGAKAKTGQLGLRENFRLTFRNKPFVLLILFSFLMVMGTGLKGGLDFFTKLYYVCEGDQKLASKISGFVSIVWFVSGMIGIRVFQWLAAKKGKRASMITLMSIVLCSSLSTLIFYTPSYPYLSIIPMSLLAPAISGMWMLIPSMTGDAADLDQLNTGHRREGSFASTYSWCLKASQSVATALSGPLVVWAGFNAKIGTEQPEEVLFLMRMLVAFLPAIFLGLAIFTLTRYPLTTRRIEEIHDELKRRRESEAAA